MRASLTYEKGVTDIGTPVSDVLHGGAGVCQDFAHLAVALARSVGIPARYVSGYLFSADDATADRTDQPVVHVQTHAWIEAAIPGTGWFPLDPTNGRKVDEMHVKVGHGRDYDDVSPFRGVHQGVASASLEAAVEIRKGEPMLPGGLFSMLDATWGDTPGTPLRVTLGRAPRSRCPRSTRRPSNNSNNSSNRPFLRRVRRAVSSGGGDELVETFGWSLPVEGFAGSFVQECGDVVEVLLGCSQRGRCPWGGTGGRGR